MTRKVEEILKLVAESSHYTPVRGIISSSYMCYALDYSKNAGLVSKKERSLATKAIEEYLNKLNSASDRLEYALEDALRDNEFPNTFEDRKAIYLDWKKRPKP